MARVPLAIVVAVARNGVIGRDGDMPWKLSTDLKRFKAMTLGKPMIVGRKTLDSFGGKPLPGRPHIIVTRDLSSHIEGAQLAGSVEAAVAIAQVVAAETGVDEIGIIGGGEIYRQSIDLVERLYVTHVETDIADGDTFFPDIDPEIFEKVSEEAVPAGEKDNYATRFAIYRRKIAAN
ncbi:dihydrofolate reductase [Aliirhizobium smilacinae]|uniref:Dihydrofolate reductase n=1 Tax=Aliirhizobium smilacinae TaxID=1395944 RepID=A0A5C4XFC9_9HYPH|nr:dihydrofolate reductase [Rhizobium smilacinae]TNM62223.1 dihydrofolate reductase [Rhizobium smilacinae]